MKGTGLSLSVLLLCAAVSAAGCVNKENYTKEVNRANNFQRLLAEEEKRSVELSAEISRLKDQINGLDAKNKSMAAQVNDAKAQVVRSLEEVGRLQDEIKQARASISAPAEPPDRLDELQPAPPVSKKKEKSKPSTSVVPNQKPPAKSAQATPPAPKPTPAPEPRPAPTPPAPEPPPAPNPPVPRAVEDSGDSFKYHVVKKGESLKSIAKLYKTDPGTLRELNDMGNADAVKPGDRIIVGQNP